MNKEEVDMLAPNQGSHLRREVLTIPNGITTLRICAAFAILWYRADPLIVFVLAVAGSLTDGLDGWVARRFDQCSALGKRLDQIADEVFGLVMVAVIVMWEGWTFYNSIPVVLIMVYTVMVSLLRLQHQCEDSNSFAKAKMGMQFVAGIGIIASHAFSQEWLSSISYLLLWASLLVMRQALREYLNEAK